MKNTFIFIYLFNFIWHFDMSNPDSSLVDPNSVLKNQQILDFSSCKAGITNCLEGRCPAEFSSNLPQHTCLEASIIKQDLD